MAYDVFISYETLTGTSYAENLNNALKKSEKRFNSFLARKNLLGTYKWKQKIDEALEEAPLFIIIFTSLTNSSDEVKRECTKAIKLEKKILTCRWHKISLLETEKLAKELCDLQQVQFEDKYDLANHAIHEINSLRGENNEI